MSPAPVLVQRLLDPKPKPLLSKLDNEPVLPASPEPPKALIKDAAGPVIVVCVPSAGKLTAGRTAEGNVPVDPITVDESEVGVRGFKLPLLGTLGRVVPPVAATEGGRTEGVNDFGTNGFAPAESSIAPVRYTSGTGESSLKGTVSFAIMDGELLAGSTLESGGKALLARLGVQYGFT